MYNIPKKRFGLPVGYSKYQMLILKKSFIMSLIMWVGGGVCRWLSQEWDHVPVAETGSGGGRSAVLEALPICLRRFEELLRCGTHPVRWAIVDMSFYLLPCPFFGLKKNWMLVCIKLEYATKQPNISVDECNSQIMKLCNMGHCTDLEITETRNTVWNTDRVLVVLLKGIKVNTKLTDGQKRETRGRLRSKTRWSETLWGLTLRQVWSRIQIQ